MPIGNPQDILTTPYGYSGQVAPETAVNLQNLNRRRLIANMLMQQGAQPAEGQMVGRFYVPAGLARGFSGLGQTLAGALLAGNIDKKSSQAVDADRQMVVDAIKAYQDASNAGQAQQGQGAPLVQPPPTPDQPFSGEVGATPMPEPGVTVAPRVPPFHGIAPGRPTEQGHQANSPQTLGYAPPFHQFPDGSYQAPAGQNASDMQPADMSAMVNSANPEMAQAQAATAQTIPQVEPPPPAVPPPPSPGPAGPQMQDGRATLAQLMTHQHPQVRAYGQFLAAMQQREQERTDTQAFNREQRDLDREVRREGILSNALTRAEMIRGNMINTQAQIEARLQAGRDASDLKAELARQQAELKQLDITTRAETAKQHDQTLKAIAELNVGGRKEIAAMKADPRNKTMSPTAQKELFQTEEELQGAQQAIHNLNSALAINDKAMGFTGAGLATSIGSMLPEGLRPETVDATADLDNLITGSALPQLKAIFGGMPTEGERKILLEMQGSSSKPPKQREAIFKRAIEAAENKIRFGKQKAEQLRSGQYFAGDGGLDTSFAPSTSPGGTQGVPSTGSSPKVRKYNPATGKIE